MFALRVDKWLRVVAGFGLLGLLVVQEKVWPWLLKAPGGPDTRAVAPGHASKTDPASEKRVKPGLPLILPDTPISRWPAGWLYQTTRHTAGDRDGVTSCGPQNPRSAGPQRLPALGADPLAWHCFQTAADGPRCADLVTQQPCHADPAVHTCISRTGPPLG
jgi:hypothetical protein